MRQGQRPQTEVGSGVGDASQHKLDGMDALLHQHLAELKLLLQLLLPLAVGQLLLGVGR